MDTNNLSGGGCLKKLKDNGEGKFRTIFPPTTPLTQFMNLSVNGDYVAKGIGMRGTGNGVIDFTGQIPPGSTIIAALLYWAIIQESNGAVNTTGTLNGFDINGTIIGTAGEPCWLNNGLIYALYADVTNIVNTGVNTLTNFPTGPDFNTPPLLEGASLIIIYGNSRIRQNRILVYHGAVTFATQIVETDIEGFTAPEGPLKAKTTYIVADGQSQLWQRWVAKMGTVLVLALFSPLIFCSPVIRLIHP